MTAERCSNTEVAQNAYFLADVVLKTIVVRLQGESSKTHRDLRMENLAARKATRSFRTLVNMVTRMDDRDTPPIGIDVKASEAYRSPEGSSKKITDIRNAFLKPDSLISLDGFLGLEDGDYGFASVTFDGFKRIGKDWYMHITWGNTFIPVKDIRQIKAGPKHIGR